MDFIIGFAALLVFQVIGEIGVIILELPISGPVAGLILMFIALLIRGRVDQPIQAAVTPLLSHLSLLFIPAGVGIMLHYKLLEREWPAIVITLGLTTTLMLISTVLIMNALTHLVQKGKKHD